jgi:hypothetical protein
MSGVIPERVLEVIGQAKRRRDEAGDSELGAPRGQLSVNPAPELLASRVPSKVKIARGSAGKPVVAIR